MGFSQMIMSDRDHERFFLLRMHGTGEYTFSTGTRYVGECRDGMFHGKGVMHFPNGTKYEATWENGRVVEVRSTE